MSCKYNLHLIKERASYSVDQMALLFGVNKKTPLRWLGEGLSVIEENTKPLLVMGKELKKFLRLKKQKRKTTLAEGEYYCMKCQRGVGPTPGSEHVTKTGKVYGKNRVEQLKRVALCANCGTKVIRYLGVSQKD